MFMSQNLFLIYKTLFYFGIPCLLKNSKTLNSGVPKFSHELGFVNLGIPQVWDYGGDPNIIFYYSNTYVWAIPRGT